MVMFEKNKKYAILHPKKVLMSIRNNSVISPSQKLENSKRFNYFYSRKYANNNRSLKLRDNK